MESTLADEANHAFWRGIATGAEGGGLVNAARHMHHFLDNTGSLLEVDLDGLEATSPTFADNVADAYALAYDEALETLDGADHTLSGSWGFEERYVGNDSYFSSSEDWYYAIGGNTHIASGTVRYEPGSEGEGQLNFSLDWRLTDRYNWDGGKSVDILGVTATRTDEFSHAFSGETPGEGSTVPGGDGGRNERSPRTGRDDLGRDRR